MLEREKVEDVHLPQFGVRTSRCRRNRSTLDAPQRWLMLYNDSRRCERDRRWTCRIVSRVGIRGLRLSMLLLLIVRRRRLQSVSRTRGALLCLVILLSVLRRRRRGIHLLLLLLLLLIDRRRITRLSVSGGRIRLLRELLLIMRRESRSCIPRTCTSACVPGSSARLPSLCHHDGLREPLLGDKVRVRAIR